MKHFAVAALMVASASGASDFSALGRPEVVRSVLIPQPRLREVQCTAFAMARSEQEHFLEASLVTALRESVVARAAVDIGDAAYARASLEDRAQGFRDDPTWIFPDSRKAAIDGVRASCAAFFATVRERGVAGSLSPAPIGPIGLPDGPTCYAAMKDADRRELALGQTQGEPYLDDILFRDAAAGERAANRVAVDKALKTFAAHPLDPERLEMTITFACMPALAALAKRYPPRPEAETER